MLRAFRRVRSSWIVVGLLGLIMLAFVITGVGTRDVGGIGQMGQGPEHVATIDGEALTTNEVTERLNRALNAARQQNPDLDMTAFIRAGAVDELLNQLIMSKVILAFGTKEGLAVSKRQIDGEIASIPAFRNAAGRFDDETFRNALAQNKVTESQVRDDFRLQIIQQQLLLPIAAGAKVPVAMARAYAALLLEARTGSVGLVPVQAVGGGAPPTDAEVAAFFKANAARYIVPERRVLRYATFGMSNVAAAAAATEAEITAYYQANAAEFAPRETRALSQVVLPDQNAAQAFAAKIAGGKSFAQAASEAGFDAKDTALGAQSKADLARISGPAVADAAFAAAKGAVTPPIRSPLGWHIIKVDSITAIPGRPLAAVRADIAQKIGADKANAALSDLATRIEDAIGDGASFAEVVKANNLAISETAPVTAAGTAPDTPGYQLPPEAAPLLKPAFDLTPDDDPVVETIAQGQRYALLTLGRVVAAAPPPFAQVAAQVRADLIHSRAEARAKVLANQLLAKINAGTPIREAFAKAGVALPPVRTTTARRMDIAQAGDRVPPPVRAIFSLGRGRSKLLPAPNNAGWFIVHLDQIAGGNIDSTPGLVEATRSQFGQVVGNEYAEQFANAAEREVTVRRDDAAMARLKQQLQGKGQAAE